MHKEKLNEFIKEVKRIPEIIALYYAGSTATESWDKYSDLDIDLVVEDKNFRKLFKKLPKLAGFFGKIKFSHSYGGSEFTSFIGEDYFKVELDLIKKSSLKPNNFLKTIKIIFDKEGTLMKAYKKSRNIKRSKIKHQDVINFFLALRDGQIWTARQYARGQKFSAGGEVSTMRNFLLDFLAKINDVECYDLLRKANKYLSKKERDFFKRGGRFSTKKKEVQKEMVENWKFMKYLEKKYENKSKQKLNLKCEDTKILKIVKEIYSEAK